MSNSRKFRFILMLHCLAMLCLSLWINTFKNEKFIFHWIQYIFIYGFHIGLKILVLIKYQCEIHRSILFRLRFSVSGQNQSSKRTFYPKGIYNNKHYNCTIVSCFGNCKVIIIIVTYWNNSIHQYWQKNHNDFLYEKSIKIYMEMDFIMAMLVLIGIHNCYMHM